MGLSVRIVCKAFVEDESFSFIWGQWTGLSHELATEPQCLVGFAWGAQLIGTHVGLDRMCYPVKHVVHEAQVCHVTATNNMHVYSIIFGDSPGCMVRNEQSSLVVLWCSFIVCYSSWSLAYNSIMKRIFTCSYHRISFSITFLCHTCLTSSVCNVYIVTSGLVENSFLFLFTFFSRCPTIPIQHPRNDRFWWLFIFCSM